MKYQRGRTSTVNTVQATAGISKVATSQKFLRANETRPSSERPISSQPNQEYREPVSSSAKCQKNCWSKAWAFFPAGTLPDMPAINALANKAPTSRASPPKPQKEP